MPRDVQAPTLVKSDAMHGDQYAHPAFGHIQVSRVQGRANLFGSDFEHSSYVVVRIGSSKHCRSLHRDWHFPERNFVEVALSEAQWATFVSSSNQGSGVQCTIQFRDRETIPGLPPRDEKDKFSPEVQERLDKATNGLAMLVRDLKEGGLAGVPKSKAAQIVGPIEMALMELRSNVPFVKKSFDEHVEARMEKAKVEIYGWMEQSVRRAGLVAIAQQEGSPIMLEGPDGAGDHHDR